MTSPAASGPYLSKFEKRPKMPHPMALFALSLAVSKSSSNFPKKIPFQNHQKHDSRCGMSDVAFRTAPPISGLSCWVMFKSQFLDYRSIHFESFESFGKGDSNALCHVLQVIRQFLLISPDHQVQMDVVYASHTVKVLFWFSRQLLKLKTSKFTKRKILRVFTSTWQHRVLPVATK